MLGSVLWNVFSGTDQRVPGDAHNSFVWPAGCVEGHGRTCVFGDVDSNDSKVTVGHFQYIGASLGWGPFWPMSSICQP